MSRGPGRIERAIEALFQGHPDDAFTIEDIADRVYAGINRTEKRHRVSVLRAVHETAWMEIVVSPGDGVSVHGERKLSERGRVNEGRPESGIALAARELPIPGKTNEAKRIHLSRSRMIATKTTPEAAEAAEKAGLADSTTALLKIARTAPPG